MRVEKGQVYLRWTSGDDKEHVKALYRLPNGDWMVQPYDVQAGKCVGKAFSWPRGLMSPSEVRLEVKREDPDKKMRRQVKQRINRNCTREFRSECRRCKHFRGGWDSPVTCYAPKPGTTNPSLHYLVGFTERHCPQREQRQVPTTPEGEGC